MTVRSMVVMLIYTALSATALIILRLALPKMSSIVRERNWASRETVLLLVGIVLYGITLVMWLWLVASNPLSVAYPVAVGLITVFTAIGSYLVTRDGYTVWHAVGAALVLSGVTVIALAGGGT